MKKKFTIYGDLCEKCFCGLSSEEESSSCEELSSGEERRKISNLSKWVLGLLPI